MTSYSPVIASTITMPSLPLRASATCWALPALAVTSTYARIISLLPRLKRSATVAWVHAVGHRDPAPRPACGEPLFLAAGDEQASGFRGRSARSRCHAKSPYRRRGGSHGGEGLDPADVASPAHRRVPDGDGCADGRRRDHRHPEPQMAGRDPASRSGGHRRGDLVRGTRPRRRGAGGQPAGTGRAAAPGDRPPTLVERLFCCGRG